MGATTVDAHIAIKSSRTWFGLNARRLAYVGALTVNIVRRVVAQPRRLTSSFFIYITILADQMCDSP